ncbi:MAG: TetR/AcrR family transcriptional regulator [Rhodoferax sp.]
MPTPDPLNADSRTRLVHAAAAAFRREGYRASIDRIAQQAAVCRQTVYNHFATKEDLFSEVAHLAARELATSLEGEVTDSATMRARLEAFALRVQQRLLSPEGLAIYRTIAAEVPRLPALGQAFFDKGPRQTMAALRDFLQRAMDAGLLRADDPQWAAERLMGLLTGFEHTKRLFCPNTADEPLPDARAQRCVDDFLRIYCP